MHFEPVRKAIEFERTEAALRTLKRVGKVVSMKEVTQIVGTDINSDRLRFHLIRSMQEDHRAGRPFQASLIVGNNQLPPDEYFRTAQQLGYNVGDRKQFWTTQLQRLGIQNVGRSGNRNSGTQQGQGQQTRGQSNQRNQTPSLSSIGSWYSSDDSSTRQRSKKNRSGMNVQVQNQGTGQNQSRKSKRNRSGGQRPDQNGIYATN